MSEPLALPSHGLLAISPRTLAALRATLLRDATPAGAIALQDAGYAGGEAVWTAFRQWLAASTDADPATLALPDFEQRLGTFFHAAGWGRLTIDTIDDLVATIDASAWGESDPADPTDFPSCLVSTGLFADLFARVAGAPVAVLEVACRSAGAGHCRFLVGSPAVMDRVYAAIAAGTPYEEAVRQCA